MDKIKIRYLNRLAILVEFKDKKLTIEHDNEHPSKKQKSVIFNILFLKPCILYNDLLMWDDGLLTTEKERVFIIISICKYFNNKVDFVL